MVIAVARPVFVMPRATSGADSNAARATVRDTSKPPTIRPATAIAPASTIIASPTKSSVEINGAPACSPASSNTASGPPMRCAAAASAACSAGLGDDPTSSIAKRKNSPIRPWYSS